MGNESRIAVAMSVHRGAGHVHFKESLDSLFNQDYLEWKLFLFCDGPLTPELEDLVGALPCERCTVLRSAENIGLAAGLNQLLDAIVAAGGFDFVARMDADDVCLSTRFSRQVSFFMENPGISILGTWCKEIDEDGNILFNKELPIEHRAMVGFMVVRNPIVHPSAMIRTAVFQSGVHYAAALRQMQDYELWSRLARSGFKMANLPEFLLLFRLDKKFYARRTGLKRAWTEVMMRVDHMRHFRLFSLRNAVLLTCFFCLRVAPESWKRLAYQRMR